MSLVSQTSTGTLAQRLQPRQSILANTFVFNSLLVVGAALFVALCAQISIPLPFSPVPITGQTLGVMLAGGLIGWRLGGTSMLLYLALASIGLPFYADGESGLTHLAGATGGYLVAFPLAAALIGWLSERGWDRKFWTTAVAMVLGNVVIYVLGAGWLAVHIGLADAIALGVLPFLIGNALKILAASAVLPSGWKLLGTRNR